MHLTLWPDNSFNPDSGMDLRIEGDQAYGRFGQVDWEPVDNVGDLLAPGGDPLGFLSGIKDVVALSPESRSLAGLATPVTFTRYSFSMDRPAFASRMRDQMEMQLREQGKLPSGLELSASDTYHLLTGQGILWLDEQGLPTRLSLDLALPAHGESGRTTIQINTDYTDYDVAAIEKAQTPLFNDPAIWLQNRLPELVSWQQTAANSGTI